MDRKLVFIDVETSGGAPLRDRVIEVGMVVVEGGKVTDTYQTLVNPGCSVPPEILSMTGIKPQDLETAPEFGLIAAQIRERLEGAVFVAHNARFDFGFIKSEFARLDQRVWWPQLCTVKLSRRLYPEQARHGLDALIDRFNLSCEDRHRALGDAQATWEFFRLQYEKRASEEVEKVVKDIIRKPALPPALAEVEMEKLPQLPGVYLFYGGKNELLYVGKSINLRDRVWGHFYLDYESPKEMAIKNQVTRIETRPTAGELEALLLEARLVKELQPLYNRHLRQVRELWVLLLDKSEPAYKLKLEKRTSLVNGELDEVIGVFRRRGQALKLLSELAEKYQLCHRQLGLEKTRSACFAYHLGNCRGVCADKETPESFNLRLISALAEIKLPSWPYQGLLGVREQSEETNRVVHLFDRWCYLGSLSEEELAEAEPSKLEGEFDLDMYHILRRFLKGANSDQIFEI